MAGLVPAIHDVNTEPAGKVEDARHEAGHDGRRTAGDAEAATPFQAGFRPTSPRHGEAERPPHSAAMSCSASPRSTLTSVETPRSAMVTPKSRFMRLMVMGLWVMTTKRVSVVRAISSSRSQ